jgi:hypothetical protein
MLELLGSLLDTVIDALGLTGYFSDRHRPWILRLFKTLFVLVILVIVVALAMVLTGHD